MTGVVTGGRAKLCARVVSCAILLLLTVAAFHLEAEEQKVVRVAAAADLKFAMDELSKDFESKTGTRVDLTTG